MYRALPVYGFYYISLGVAFIHWRMRMWWLTPAWGQTALTASIILMLMDEVVSWWWCYHVFVILYDDCDDDIKRYILFLELLEHMLSFFSTAMTIAPQQSVGQVGSWKQAPWSRRQRGNGACKEMLLTEFQVSPGLWVFYKDGLFVLPMVFVGCRKVFISPDYGPTLESWNWDSLLTFQQKDASWHSFFPVLDAENQDLFATLTSREA